MKEDKKTVNYKDLISLLKASNPGVKLIIACVALILIEAVLGLLVPLQTKYLLDELNLTSQLSWHLVFMLAGVLIIGSIASGILSYLLGLLGNKQKLKLRKKFFNHLIHLPISFFDKTASGEPANRLTKDTEVIEDFVSQGSHSLISGLILLIGSFFVLWWLDWRLTAVLFSAVVISFLVILPFTIKLSSLSKSLQDEEANLMARVTEVLSQIRLIRSHNAHKVEANKNNEKFHQIYNISMKETRLLAIMSPLINIVVMATIICVLGYGATLVSNGDMTIGTFVAFIMYLINVVAPFAQLSMFVAMFNKAAGAAVRISEILKLKQQNLSGLPILIKNQDISFKNLNFAYKNKPDLFKELSFTLPAGKTTALVGTSGAGKSSLFSLLQGFYNAQAGQIYFGVQALDNSSLTSLYQQTGYVAQDSPVLSGSIYENLIYGLDEKPSENQIEQSLNDADLQSYIATLDKGLDTQIGERGISLSGGQRQRLALARALLKDPALLILDEVTASLDSNSEDKIQQALKQACNDRTTLIAAHRLSTVLHADQILLLKDGKIIASGQHQQLMQEQSFYRNLMEKQFKLPDMVNEA
ncbi:MULTISPECIES: ABC transporter ATP-binding protein [unclassified Pseudoalteromonas]|uniref:ABC transporter ATP-binding protein n=1 Tax=unclassified Pseudoalteromonas TaxID=194690 RepID=UPI0005A746AA|nr:MULTISPECIES: ABC transporter ATP-binding protein [unclassified Pseudoalteromonas]